MFSITDLFGKIDPTKIKVTGGDIPEGDWIFNGHAMVFSPKQTDINQRNDDASKMVVTLKDKVRIVPIKAEEFGVLRQLGANMAPLGGAIAGASIGLIGIMGGFAAGSMLGRNVSTFHCELDDGRRFDAIADYKIFRRVLDIAIK